MGLPLLWTWVACESWGCPGEAASGSSGPIRLVRDQSTRGPRPIQAIPIPGEPAGDLQEAFSGIRPSIQDDILHTFPEDGIEFFVDGKLSGIDDRHIETGLDRMKKKDRVHGLAHGIVSTKRKGKVADAAARFAAREQLFQPSDRFDEIDGIRVVFFNSGGHGKNVGIEDDIFFCEAGFFGQEPVGSRAGVDTTFHRIRLSLFVKSHDDYRGPESSGLAGMV